MVSEHAASSHAAASGPGAPADPIAGVPAAARKQVAAWLLGCAALVFAMVVVGGITRLTHSGLSIVEWKPLVGALPPFSEHDWLALFDKYKQTPEYRTVNLGMTLHGFKHIFWWEYFHRLLGRTIGVVFGLPLVVFVARRQIPRAFVSRLAGIFALGGAQGAMGWYMVASGLVDDPRVSPYRLSAHLGLAFAIMVPMVWLALDLLGTRAALRRRTPLANQALVLSGLIFVMVLTGGFVAGTRAGFAFNTFPLMGDFLLPPGMWGIEPWWRNPFENIVTVQFDHRFLAMIVTSGVIAMWARCRKDPRLSPQARRVALYLFGALCLQVGLGIATLLYVVPVPLAAAHQAGAAVLFAVSIWLAHAIRTSAPAVA